MRPALAEGAPLDARLMATPVFVLGSPRSGTTLVGAHLGTCDQAADFQELGVFYFTRSVAPRGFQRVPSPLKHDYLAELRTHAIGFARRQARQRGKAFFIDSTPWNLLIAAELREALPDALFVLTLRHYSGVVQSLERSRSDGWAWGGQDLRQRIGLWCKLYAHAHELPAERTVVLSYDALCNDPTETLRVFGQRLSRLGFPSETLSLAPFAHSYATTHPRPTLGRPNEDGSIVLRSIPSFDRAHWEQLAHGEPVDSLTREVDAILREHFPSDYTVPSEWPSGSSDD